MNKRLLIFTGTLCLGLFFNTVLACSCSYGGKFSEYAKGSIIISGKITQYGPSLGHGETLYQDMEVEVIDVIQGDFKHQSVKLLGDPGHLCRPYVDSRTYKINSTFLIALAGEGAVQPFQGCGESAVLLEGETIHGQDYIDDKLQNYTTTLQELKMVLKANQ